MTITGTLDTQAVQRFEVTVQLVSPVCLAAAVPAGNLTRTLEYIPGSTVRGVLAALYLESGKPADAIFERLFLTGEVTYGNLCLNGAAPSPLSARSCKHEPGFIDDRGHGVVDWLLPSFAQQRGKDSNLAVSAPRHEACADTSKGSVCGAPLESFAHFYFPLMSNRKSMETSKLRRIITRSATDDRLQTAEQGLLYSLEVLDPTTPKVSPQFRGSVTCITPDVADIALRELFQPIFERQAIKLFLGTARSRGLGEVEAVDCQPYAPPFPSLTDRLQTFNQRLHDWGVSDSHTYFSLTLHADAIIQDEYFRFHSTIPAVFLAWEAGFSQETAARLKLEGCFTATRTVSGWNAALRAPKTDATAIKMGAAFLYSAEGLNEQDLIDKLARVEAYGLGARRTEGFGRVVVCDPFHLDAGKEPI